MARIKHGTLTNGQVDVVLDQNWRFVEVLVRNTDAELWIQADPTVAGAIAEEDDVDVIPSTGGSVIVESTSNASTIVRLETDGTVDWSVKGLEE